MASTSNRLTDRSAPKSKTADETPIATTTKPKTKSLEKGKGRERTGLVKDPYAAFKAEGAGSDYSDVEDEEVEVKGTAVEIQQAGRKRALSISPPPTAPEASQAPTNKAKGKGKEVEVAGSRTGPRSGPIQRRPEGEGPPGKRPFRPREEDVARERQPSLRDIKKEAQRKHHTPTAGGGGRGGRGQPNMGARMDVLLEAIKRGGK
jgi:hypothetical protein